MRYVRYVGNVRDAILLLLLLLVSSPFWEVGRSKASCRDLLDPLGGVPHWRVGAVSVTASQGVSAGRFVSPFVNFSKTLVVVNGTLSPEPVHPTRWPSVSLGEVSGCAPTRQRHRVTRCLRGSLRLDAPPPMPWLRSPGQSRFPGLTRKPLRA